jgi:hypothetical protein
MSSILIWKHTVGSAPSGANGLTSWTEYVRSGKSFRRTNTVGQVYDLSAMAATLAIDKGVNVSVGWSTVDPSRVSADELEQTLMQLRPRILICPERPGKPDRWAIASGGGTPESLPLAAIQKAVNDQVAALYPRWLHGITWNATAFLLRHDISAEELALIEPEPLTGDRILGMVATDEAVREANKVADPGVPGSIHALAAARLAAQERLGIPEDKRVIMFSTEAETLLTGPLMRMGRGDEMAALALLRRQLRAYGPLAEFALTSALRDFGHNFPYLESLRAAAKASAPSVAA